MLWVFRGWQDGLGAGIVGASPSGVDVGPEVFKDLDQVGLNFQGVAGTQGVPSSGGPPL